jgi:hypothetical protein
LRGQAFAILDICRGHCGDVAGIVATRGQFHDLTTGEFIVTTDDRIWIGQNDQKYGPYSEADVRQWIAEGKLATDALAWREAWRIGFR